MKRWTQDEIEVLKKYYLNYGPKYCAGLIDRTYKAITTKIMGLRIHTKIIPKASIERFWREEEKAILIKYYPDYGLKYCTNLLNRSPSSISHKAQRLGLASIIIWGDVPRKQIIKYLDNNRVISLCKIHGETIHYLRNGKIVRCIKCHNRRTAMSLEKNPVEKLAYRLRTSLNNALRSKNIRKTQIGCLRLLPYSSQELCDHLEAIRQQQGGKCPMCCRSYDIATWTIDHIIPIKTAQNEEDTLKLFALDNLSLLCGLCNSSKGTRILTPDEIKGRRADEFDI